MPAKKTAKKAAKKVVVPVAEAPVESSALKSTEVKLGAAKGRPMLQWVGKKPLSRVTAFPAQPVEIFDPEGELVTGDGAKSGQLFYGERSNCAGRAHWQKSKEKPTRSGNKSNTRTFGQMIITSSSCMRG
jgi:hypothetical protein